MTPEEQAAADAVTNTLTGVHFEYTGAGLFGRENVYEPDPQVCTIYHNGKRHVMPAERGGTVVGYLYNSTGILRLVYENEPFPDGVIVNCHR
jgi:hypothetical protein